MTVAGGIMAVAVFVAVDGIISVVGVGEEGIGVLTAASAMTCGLFGGSMRGFDSKAVTHTTTTASANPTKPMI